MNKNVIEEAFKELNKKEVITEAVDETAEKIKYLYGNEHGDFLPEMDEFTAALDEACESLGLEYEANAEAWDEMNLYFYGDGVEFVVPDAAFIDLSIADLVNPEVLKELIKKYMKAKWKDFRHKM